LCVIQHGRTKVKASPEQEEAKRKAREEKVKEYRRVTGKIYSKVNPSFRAKAVATLLIMFLDQLTCTALVGVRIFIPSFTLALRPCVYKKKFAKYPNAHGCRSSQLTHVFFSFLFLLVLAWSW